MSLDVYLKAAGTCPTCSQPCGELDYELYSANITHNLNKMAEAAGIYKALWHPEDIGITTAGHLIPWLKQGLERLKNNPTHFQSYNAPNGWGMYEHLVPFVEKYLKACEEHPMATVHVSR